jgi:uncharacterized protein (TIGR03382 family)
MKSVIASLVAVAGLSVAAVAEVNTRMDMLVSVDGGAFGSSVEITEGTGLHNVEVLVSVSYIGTAAPLGLASLVFQPTVSNFGGSSGADVALAYANGGAGSNVSVPSGVVSDSPGQYGRISPWGRTSLTSSTAIFNHLHTGGSAGAPAGNWLRVAQRQITSWIGGTGNTTGGSGVNIAQLADVGRTASDPAFNAALSNVHVFRFGMTIDSGSADGVGRTLTVDAPLDGFGNRNTAGERQVYWFGSMTESSGTIRGTALVNAGSINIIPIPTPATMALLGLGGLCVARRRR